MTNINDQVIIRTNDEYNKVTAVVEQVHADGSATLYNEAWDDAMTFEQDEYYNPQTHKIVKIWADGWDLEVIEPIKMNRVEVEEVKIERGFGWCDKCHSYCYGDCES